MTYPTMSIVIVFVLASAINALEIVDSEPKSKSVTVKEGESFSIWCKSNDYWEWCKITHVGSAKSCEYVWNKTPYNVKERNCNDFEGRFAYIGDRAASVYKCGILVKDMSPEDEGEWKCDIWGYYDGSNRYRSSVSKVSKSFEVDIEVKTTTTTTTSTTTTSTTTTTTAATTTTTTTTTTLTSTTTTTVTTTISATTTTTTMVSTITTSAMNTTAESFIVTSTLKESTEDIYFYDYDVDNSVTTNPNGKSDEANSSAGTPVAIVMVILLVLIALGFVFGAKRHNKWCFQQNHLQLYKTESRVDVELAKSLADQTNGVAGENEKPESDQKLNLGGE